jgi:hypothetical protein
MRSILRVVTALAGCVLFGTSQAIDFPPLGDRYANIPEEAEDTYKSLKRLEARTEIGVNYVDYNRVIGDTFPDVKLFLESREAKQLPELAFVLDNAMDCYVEVNRLWGLKVGSGSAIDKYNASMTLITAQPMLWRVAATNLSGAKAILESETGELEAAQKLIAAGSDSLTLEGALQSAIDEEIRLGREMRAKATGCPVPPEVGGADLEQRVFPQGKVDETFAAGAMTKRLPRIFDKVPPASEEGSVDVLKDGQRQSIVTVFRYNDPAVTTKAFDALTQNLVAADRKPHAGLGNRAMVSDKAAVFRRGDVVVYTQGSVPQEQMLSMLAAIDHRIKESIGPGQDIEEPVPPPVNRPVAVEIAPAPAPPKDEAKNPFADILFQAGDLGEAVIGLGFKDSLPPIMSDIRGATAVGAIDLGVAGKVRGGVTGLAFAGEAEAKAAYDSIAGGFGKSATTVDGLGDSAITSSVPGIGMCDILFRRGSTVIHARCPVQEPQAAISLARRIERRLAGGKGQDADKAGGNGLANLLLADGDLNRGVEPGGFQENRHAEFQGLPGSRSGGMYSLTAAGAPFGTVAGLEYESLEAAKDIFAAWTAKPRGSAKVTRVSGVGSKSYRRETRYAVEYFVVRDRYLLFISGPPSSDKDLLRLARRIDNRIRDARAAAKDAAAVPDDE